MSERTSIENVKITEQENTLLQYYLDLNKEVNDAYIDEKLFKNLSAKIVDFAILLENSKDISSSVRTDMTKQLQRLDKQAVNIWKARKALRELDRERAQRGNTQKAYEKAWITLMEIEKNAELPKTIMGIFKRELHDHLIKINRDRHP